MDRGKRESMPSPIAHDAVGKFGMESRYLSDAGAAAVHQSALQSTYGETLWPTEET
jgi:hypothetical protein